jgi:hypothetical protein
MSQPPAPYDRQYNFTSYQTANPSAPLPGQKVDQELNAVRSALNATQSRLGEIQADDGAIRTSALNIQVIAEEVEPLLTDAPILAVEQAGAQQVGLVNDAGDAKIADMLAILSSQNAQEAIAAKDAAESAADIAASSATLANGYAGSAQAYANTALQAKNSAIVHAQVAQDAAASIPLIVGPVGPAGPQGQQGNPGVAGQQGIQGVQGPAGNAWVYRGEYNNGVTYNQNDHVSLNGSSYVLINYIGAAGYGPITHPNSWQTVANRGGSGVASASSPLSYDAGSANISIDLSGYAAQSDWKLQAVASSSYLNLNNPATSGLFNFTYYDGYVGADQTIQLEIQSPVDGTNYNGYSVSFDTSQSNGYWNVMGSSVTIGINGYSNMQDALNNLGSGNSTGGWKLIGSGSPYVDASVLSAASNTVYNVPITAQPGDTLVLRNGLQSNLNELLRNQYGANKLLATDEKGDLYTYASNYYLTAGIASDAYMPRFGGTFAGKVNFAPGSTVSPINIGSGSSPSSSVAGDIWMGTNTISYKDGANLVRTITANGLTNTFSAPQIIDTTATTPALRVTQKGTGNSLIVEDALNPDTTALVVDASGNVGIGVATGFAATAKLDVVGNSKATTFSNGSGPTFSVNSTTSHTGGSATLDLLVTIGGVNYRIGLRPA